MSHIAAHAHHTRCIKLSMLDTPPPHCDGGMTLHVSVSLLCLLRPSTPGPPKASTPIRRRKPEHHICRPYVPCTCYPCVLPTPAPSSCAMRGAKRGLPQACFAHPAAPSTASTLPSHSYQRCLPASQHCLHITLTSAITRTHSTARCVVHATAMHCR